MSLRLVCGDGTQTAFPKVFLQDMSLFKNHPELAESRSYTLRCKPSPAVVNLLLDQVYGESTGVEITQDNFNELSSLCSELGYSKLDPQLRAFKAIHGDSTIKQAVSMLEERVDDIHRQNRAILRLLATQQDYQSSKTREALEKDITDLKAQLTRHEQLFMDLQRRLGEVIDEKKKSDSSLQSACKRVEALEKKVQEVVNNCETKIRTALNEYAKQRDLNNIASDVAQLKTSERGIRDLIRSNKGELEQSMTRQLEAVKKRVEEVSREAKSTPTSEFLRRYELNAVANDVKRLDQAIRDLIDKNKRETQESIDKLKKGGNAPPQSATGGARVPTPAPVPSRMTVRKDYNPAQPFSGLIGYLMSLGDGKRVHVRASGCSRGNPEDVIRSDGNPSFVTSNAQDSWICLDFDGRSVIPTSYSLKSTSMPTGGHHLSSWVLEGWTGMSWQRIDEQVNVNSLNKKDAIQNFQIYPVPTQAFKQLRIKQRGVNCACQWALALGRIEIFGTVSL